MLRSLTRPARQDALLRSCRPCAWRSPFPTSGETPASTVPARSSSRTHLARPADPVMGLPTLPGRPAFAGGSTDEAVVLAGRVVRVVRGSAVARPAASGPGSGHEPRHPAGPG